MHKIEPFKARYHLIGQQGERYVYNSLGELVKQFSNDFIAEHVGTNFLGTQWQFDDTLGKFVPAKWRRDYDFVVRTCSGEIVSREEVLSAHWAWYWERRKKSPKAVHRPMPGSKSERGWWNGHWRWPKTMNARRGYQVMEGCEPEGRVKAIDKIPVYRRYDDWWHEKQCQRSWKKHRRMQWKPPRVD